jgi:hypothetical protein
VNDKFDNIREKMQANLDEITEDTSVDVVLSTFQFGIMPLMSWVVENSTKEINNAQKVLLDAWATMRAEILKVEQANKPVKEEPAVDEPL